jgi:hypothetical protein
LISPPSNAVNPTRIQTVGKQEAALFVHGIGVVRRGKANGGRAIVIAVFAASAWLTKFGAGAAIGRRRSYLE